MRRSSPLKPRRYAEGTSVSVASTREELERLVRTHGASGYASSWDRDRYTIMFELKGRRVRFDVQSPSPKEYRDNGTRARTGSKRGRFVGGGGYNYRFGGVRR